VLVCLSPMIVWQVESDTEWGSAERWRHVEMQQTEMQDTTPEPPTVGPDSPS
jgi:hypothetical protein